MRLFETFVLALVARSSEAGLRFRAESFKTQKQRRSLSLRRQATVQRRELGSWWSYLFNHVGQSHTSDGGSSGGSSTTSGNGSGSAGSSSSGTGSGEGSNSGSTSNGGSSGGSESSGASSGSSERNGSENSGSESSGGSSSGSSGEDGGNNDGSSSTVDEGDEMTDVHGSQSRWHWFWNLFRSIQTPSRDNDSDSLDTGDTTSTADANGESQGFDGSGLTSLSAAHIVAIVVSACAVAALIVGAVIFLVKSTDDNELGAEGKDSGSTDVSVNSAIGTPSAVKVGRKKASKRYRGFGKTHKEPLIVMQGSESDESASTSTSDESAPRAPCPTHPPGIPRYVPDVSDDDVADVNNNDNEEESVVSIYTFGQEDASICSRTVSTDGESAPMDEAADRKSRQPPTPPPVPMDEQAIDAAIQRSLNAANEIIKQHRSRNSRPYVIGLTELDNI